MTDPMTPDEREKLRLAEGSEWKDGAIVDIDEVCIATNASTVATNATVTLSYDDIDRILEVSAYTEDALAAIRSKGLDPEFVELQRLQDVIRRILELRAHAPYASHKLFALLDELEKGT